MTPRSAVESAWIHNRRAVLAAVLGHGRATRAEIGERAGLSKATVSRVVRTLLDEGLLVESAGPGHALGRPSASLQVQSSFARSAGVIVEDHGWRMLLGDVEGRPQHTDLVPQSDNALALVAASLRDALDGTPVPPLVVTNRSVPASNGGKTTPASAIASRLGKVLGARAEYQDAACLALEAEADAVHPLADAAIGYVLLDDVPRFAVRPFGASGSSSARSYALDRLPFAESLTLADALLTARRAADEDLYAEVLLRLAHISSAAHAIELLILSRIPDVGGEKLRIHVASRIAEAITDPPQLKVGERGDAALERGVLRASARALHRKILVGDPGRTALVASEMEWADE